MNAPERLKAGIHGIETDNQANDTRTARPTGTIQDSQGTILHHESEGTPQSKRDSGSLRDSPLRCTSPESKLSLYQRIPPLPFHNNWKPWKGYPRFILENTRQYTNTDNQARTLNRIEAFLYASICGKIPRRIARSLGRSWYRIREAKLQTGEWIELKDCIRFQQDGKQAGEARVYMLSPSYRAEIVKSAEQYGHFRGYGTLNKRMKLKPRGEAVVSGSLPRKLKAALANGTGLKARLELIHEMMNTPAAFLDLPEAPDTAEELFTKAAQAWRLLAPQLAGEELMPAWNVYPCKWIYSSKPCIQQLPGFIRLNALEGLNGQPLTEVDYSGCQLNIALHEGGETFRSDPYEIPLNHLRQYKQYADIDRATVKELTLPMLHGRTRSNYQWLFWEGKVSFPVEVYDRINEVLPELRGHPLMKLQGEVMEYALVLLIEDGTPPGLPVFDSIVSPFPDRVERAMNEAVKTILKTDETIHLKVVHSRQLSLNLG